jgi:TonB family protein
MRRRPRSRSIGRARLAAAAVVLLAGWGAALAGGARLQAFFAADFKDQAYQQKVYQEVAAAWVRPARHPKSGGKTVVIAVIRRDGSAPGARIHHASGVAAWDAAALRAVETAAPFPPLPKSYAGASVEVHFHFEWVEQA